MINTCNECPYRKDSAPGYLGEDSYNPVHFLAQLENIFLHPCHKTVDWEEGNEIELLDAPVCRGVIQFAKNICKMLYDSPYEKERQKLKADDTVIFGTRHEFIDHHSK